MRVKRFNDKDTYKKVIEYYYNKCDTVMFIARSDGRDEIEKQELAQSMKKMEHKLQNSFIKCIHRLWWVYHENLYTGQHGLSKEEFTNQFSIYFYKFSKEVKDYLLTNQDIFNWFNPEYPEDMSFFKDGHCLFYTVTHERICEIEMESREEYEYFKSIGVIFREKYYKSKDLYYEDI